MKWTADNHLFLRRNYGTRKDAWIAEQLGCAVADVQEKASSLMLRKDKRTFKGKRMPRWKPAEVDKLRELYPENSNLAVARQLGRSVKSVVSKACQLELKKSDERLQEMGRENVSLRRGRNRS